jgi:hypothetical protein
MALGQGIVGTGGMLGVLLCSMVWLQCDVMKVALCAVVFLVCVVAVLLLVRDVVERSLFGVGCCGPHGSSIFCSLPHVGCAGGLSAVLEPRHLDGPGYRNRACGGVVGAGLLLFFGACVGLHVATCVIVHGLCILQVGTAWWCVQCRSASHQVHSAVRWQWPVHHLHPGHTGHHLNLGY